MLFGMKSAISIYLINALTETRNYSNPVRILSLIFYGSGDVL